MIIWQEDRGWRVKWMARLASEKSAKAKIRKFLDSLNIGEKFTSEDLQRVAGIQEAARRLRELRQEEGYDVLGYREALNDNLKPNEYIFYGKGAAKPSKAKVSTADAKLLLKGRPYCQLCGRENGDFLPGSNYRKVKLHVHHFLPQAREGAGDIKNLMVLCSYCNEGLQDQTLIESFVKADDLLSQLKPTSRSVKQNVQVKLGEWLVKNPEL